MKSTFFLVSILILISLIVLGQKNVVGLFDANEDIGNPKKPGSTRFDKTTRTYYLKGSGYNIWFNRDEFQYLYKKMKGDFTLTANFQFLGDTGNAHRKVGWMIRESTAEDAIHTSAVIHGDGLTVLQWRTMKGMNMRDPEDELFFPKKNFEIVQLERIGKNMTMRVGNTGEALQTVGTHKMLNMPDNVLAGLFICSHDSNTAVQGKVWNVKVTKRQPK